MLRVVNDLLQHKGLLLKTGTAVDATLISVPSSIKNKSGERVEQALDGTASVDGGVGMSASEIDLGANLGSISEPSAARR